LQLSTRGQKCAARGLITSGFPDTHAHAQQPGSSGGYELPFHAPKHASWSPWTPLDGFTRPASFTYFEALFLLRVRSRRAGLPHFDGRYSRVSSPLKLSPPSPRTLWPTTTLTSRTAPPSPC